jgi:Carboxypeptidase regulatory-like domain/TonB dependent receptor
MRTLKTSSWCEKAIQLLGGVLVILLLSVPAFSQGNAGRIMGTVTDQSGGVVAGATVTVLDTARGVTRTLTTDDAGEYNAPNLTPGTFTVRAEAKGFKKLERQNVDVGVGREIRVDVILQPGEQQQTVTVTESVPLVETTNATLGGTLDNSDIVDMPLNGRNYQNLLGLRPGVMVQPGGGPWTQSTNGVRPDESAWMVDGVINANFFDARPLLGMPSPITDGATILPIDAIQEFNTMENPKAESGWKPGAVVNVGIKSGTNQLHGSAYAFGRDGSWGARNAYNIVPVGGVCPTSPLFLSACDKLPVQLKQFGGVVGGPIKKDKLFFFGGYEGLRSFIGQALATTGIGVPATASVGNPKLSFVDAANCLTFATVAACGTGAVPGAPIPVSAVSNNLTGCTVGATPGATTCTGGFFPNNGASNAFLSTFPNSNQSDNGIGKIDYHLNEKNTINGLLAISKYNGVGEDHPYINPNMLNTFPITVWTTTENWIYTPNSSVVNEVRFGYNRMTIRQASLDAGLAFPVNTGLTTPGWPNISIKSFNSFGTQHNRPQVSGPNPYSDYQENLSYLKGKHSLKFGFEYGHLEADSNIPDTGRGKFTFSGGKAFPGSTPLEDLMAGALTNGVALVGSANRVMHWSETAGYAQDDWRITPKVTLNLGLRYSYESPIKEANNGWANFDPTSATGLVQQGSAGNATLWHPDYKDLSPRVGFAWDVTGKGSTVVRGGFSIMYSTFTAVMWMNQNTFQNSTAVSIAANPTGALIQCAGIAGEPTCPANGGGTIQLGSSTLTSGLCWDPALASCPAGQTTAFPSGGAGIICGDGINGDKSACNLLAVNPNLKTPYVENFNLGIQHQFGNNLSLEVGYVGNHGARLTGFADINQPAAGAGYCLNSLTATQLADACKGFVAPTTLADYQSVLSAGINANGPATQEARPFFSKFPYIGFINQMSNNTRSNYNSLQATLTKRMSHGLSFIAGYTYAHGLDNGSLNRFGMIPQDGTADQYGNSDFDVRHRFTLSATYNIPGIKGFGQLLEGWQINSIVNIQTAQPWRVNDGGDNFNGTNDNADLWNFTGNPASFKAGFNTIPYCTGAGGGTCNISSTINPSISYPALSNSAALWGDCLAQATTPATMTTLLSAGCYASASGNAIMTPNGLGQFGNMARNIFRDSGFKSMDFSVFKNFTFKERYGVQFRAEFFNILNHPIAANPYGASSNFNSNNDPSAIGSFGGAGGTPDVVAGNNVVGSGANRDIQLGLKLTF